MSSSSSAVTVNSTNSMVTILQGVNTAIKGVSVSDSNGDSDTVNILISDMYGILSVTGSGATVTGNSSTFVSLYGTVTQVNSALASLVDTSNTLGSDTINITASESSNPNNMGMNFVNVTVASPVTINSTSPNQTINNSVATTITGLSITDPFATAEGDGDSVYVTVSDAYGKLSVSSSGAHISGNNSTFLSLSGTLAQVNSALASLVDTSNTVGFDTINITAQDNYTMQMATNAPAVNITVVSSSTSVSTGSSSAVAQGTTTTVSGVSVSNTSSPTSATLPQVSPSAPVSAISSSSNIYTVTVSDTLGTLTDTSTNASIIGSGSKSITISGSLSHVNSALATLQYTAVSIGQDTLTVNASIQGISGVFSDTKVINIGALDNTIQNNSTNQAIDLLYQAAFNRLPDSVGLHYWTNLSGTQSLAQIANSFVSGSEFMSKYGAQLSNATFVHELYENVLGRQPDMSGDAFWISNLNAGGSRATVLLGFATSAESLALNASHFVNGFLLA